MKKKKKNYQDTFIRRPLLSSASPVYPAKGNQSDLKIFSFLLEAGLHLKEY